MNKTIEARVSISTNPAVSGRYVVDVRDTTNGADRQLTTRITDSPDQFIAELTAEAVKQDVTVETIDQTGGY